MKVSLVGLGAFHLATFITGEVCILSVEKVLISLGAVAFSIPLSLFSCLCHALL
jgi:hypothetical protein